MSAPFKPYDPDQALLFPHNLREWLPSDYSSSSSNRQIEKKSVEDAAFRVISADQKPEASSH